MCVSYIRSGLTEIAPLVLLISPLLMPSTENGPTISDFTSRPYGKIKFPTTPYSGGSIRKHELRCRKGLSASVCAVHCRCIQYTSRLQNMGRECHFTRTVNPLPSPYERVLCDLSALFAAKHSINRFAPNAAVLCDFVKFIIDIKHSLTLYSHKDVMFDSMHELRD